MYMYAIYEETELFESIFSDFKEGKHCPSKIKCMRFKFNVGIVLLKLYGWKDVRIKNVLEEKVFQTLEKSNS